MTAGREVDPRYAPCRVWQHAWEPTTVDREGRVYVQGLRCMRCATERAVRLDSRSGDRIGGSRYLYPAGYLMAQGGALTARERSELRLAEVSGHLAARDELAARRKRR